MRRAMDLRGGEEDEDEGGAAAARYSPAMCSAKPIWPGTGRHVLRSRSSASTSADASRSRSTAKGLAVVAVLLADDASPLLLLRRGVLLPLLLWSRSRPKSAASVGEVEVALIDLRRLASRDIGGGMPMSYTDGCCCCCCCCRCRKALTPPPLLPKDDGMDDRRDGRRRENGGGRVIVSAASEARVLELENARAVVVLVLVAATDAEMMPPPPFRNRRRRRRRWCWCWCCCSASSARCSEVVVEWMNDPCLLVARTSCSSVFVGGGSSRSRSTMPSP